MRDTKKQNSHGKTSESNYTTSRNLNFPPQLYGLSNRAKKCLSFTMPQFKLKISIVPHFLIYLILFHDLMFITCIIIIIILCFC